MRCRRRHRKPHPGGGVCAWARVMTGNWLQLQNCSAGADVRIGCHPSFGLLPRCREAAAQSPRSPLPVNGLVGQGLLRLHLGQLAGGITNADACYGYCSKKKHRIYSGGRTQRNPASSVQHLGEGG